MHLGIHENNGHDIELLSQTDIESQIEIQTLKKKLQKQINVKNIVLELQINLMEEVKSLMSCIKKAAEDFFKDLRYDANNFENIDIEGLKQITINTKVSEQIKELASNLFIKKTNIDTKYFGD